ncbi:MAG: TrbI/VirB10 family protein [Alphaproteobacteria bacterium]
MWNPVELRQIQNLLYVRWRVDDAATYREERTSIQLTAQSTDSKDCVICEQASSTAEKKPRQVMGLNGALYDLEADGTVAIGDKKHTVSENGIILDGDTVIGVVQPALLPLDMEHKVIGSVSETQDVIGPNGEKIGRLLGDYTIVTPDLQVVGAAVPVVSVMNEQGNVIGKLMMDGTVVDAQNTVIGRPLVDGTIVNLENAPIGYLLPWGLVIDFTGQVIGAVLPNGAVADKAGQTIARIMPSGFAVDLTGELIGSVVPQGVAVGAGCQAVGTVLLNGTVKDSYEQIVGKVLVDGTVVDDEQNDLGTVVPQGLVINEQGRISGFVNSAGKAVNAKGSVIGCINPNGSISAGKKLIGGIMQRGYVIGNACSVLGSVYPNGSVVNRGFDTIGQVLANRYVTNSANRIIGVVVPRGTAIAQGCRLLGLISKTGRVLDTTGADLGCVTPEGNVINDQNTVIGSVAMRGIVVDAQGKMIGRLRIDGKIIDKAGKVIGCVNPDGSVTNLNGEPMKDAHLIDADSTGGVPVDENGNPTGWSIVGNKVYDAQGNEIGTITSKGWLIDDKGNIIGILPPDGIVFSPDGMILGRYSQTTGVAVNMAGERFAKILPDLTAISGDTGEIIGALIADKSTFMTLDGTFIGTMQIDGMLTHADGTVAGAIRADGSVVDKSGQIVGVKIPTGDVLSVTGDVIGTVSPRGEVLSPAKTAIGRVLGNGLAISNNGAVMGGVYADILLAMGTDGLIGSTGVNGTVTDKNGRIIGKISPFGLVLGAGGELLGKTVRVGPFVDSAGTLVGWLSFKGELNDKEGRSVGQVLSNTTALDHNGRILGTLVPRGIAVNGIGAFVGSIAPNARVLGASGSVLGSFKASPYFYNVEQKIAGQRLQPGVGLDVTGNFIGWTRYDGVVENANGLIGLVSLDGRIFAENGAVIGFYVPIGTPAVNDTGKTFGFMGPNGKIISTKGDILGTAVSPTMVMSNGKPVGRLLNGTDFVSDFASAQVIGQVAPNGSLTSSRDLKPLGSVMMNGLAINLTKQVIGGLDTMGVPVSETLTVLGQTFFNGDVFSDGKMLGKTTGGQIIFDLSNKIIGHVLKPNAYIGRNGNIIGAGEGDIAVMSIAGSPIANQMPFGSALTSETLWAGGQMPSGLVVTDDGFEVGVVAADGAVLGEDNAVMARILPDGTAAGIMDRATYTVMPYAGATVRQGVPVHFKGSVLGRTSVNGGVLDATDKRINRILDDGTILGSETPLDGIVVPFGAAVNHNGDVLGMLTGDGTVQTPGNTVRGTVATNGAVKGNSPLKIEGGMVPSGLVTNGCNVLGQTTYDGQIINGRGNIVGRVLVDKTAMNKSGERIGRVAVIGAVLGGNGEFLGRSLLDASVVDAHGTNIGCVGMDGDVVDTSGTRMGCVLQRGPIISEAGEMLGRSKFDGTIVNAAGAPIGKIGGDCRTAYDMDNKVIGRMVSPDEELMYNGDTIVGTFDRGGTYYTLKGEAVFTVNPTTGEILDLKTKKAIGVLGEDGVARTNRGETLDGVTVLRDGDGNVMGIISGCSIINADGTKIASIMADGSVIDLNGELFATILGDGTLLDKNGAPAGQVSGTNTRLDRCGIKSVSAGAGAAGANAAGRRIFIGKNIYGITTNGSIVDKEGTVIGYMGEDGRPYSMDNKILTGADSSGRTRPNLTPSVPVSSEQLDQMQQLLAQKRQGMRGGIKNVIRPEGRILARSRKKQDADWGLPRIVSSWPVKMTNMILKDKAIPAVLVRSIDSRYKDVPATAIVERHIYSEEGRNIIIPAGSRLIGKISGSPGQNHVAKMELTWERLIRPDGGAFSFNATSGDAQGRGGVAAYLDEQLLAKYGKPIMSSTITSAITYMAASDDPVTTTENGTKTQSDRSKAAEDARETFRDNMDQIFQQLIDDATAIPPVVFVPAGTRMTVFSNEDLWLRSEDDDERDYDEAFGVQSKQAQLAGTSSWIDKRGTPAAQIAAGGATGNAANNIYYAPDDGYGAGTETVDQSVYEAELASNGGLLYNGNDVIDQQDYMDESLPAANTQNTAAPASGAVDLTQRVSRPVLPKAQNSGKMF